MEYKVYVKSDKSAETRRDSRWQAAEIISEEEEDVDEVWRIAY